MFKLFKESSKSSIGLEISPEGVTMAHLVMENNTISAKNLVFKPVESVRSIPEIIKSIINDYKIDVLNAAVSIPTTAAFIKRITLPDIPLEELKVIAPQEASKYLPFTVREMNVDFQVIENTKRDDNGIKKLDVILCAASKSVIKEHLDPVFEAGLGADMVDIASFAAIRTFAHENLINEPDKNFISILIGYENTDINVIQNGMPIFSYNIHTGKKNIIDNITNSIHKSKEEALHLLPEIEILVPGMEMSENMELNQASNAAKTVYSSIISEAQKIIEFFASGSNEPVNIEKIIISGTGACIKNLDKYVNSKLRLETVVCNYQFSTSIGLALKGFEN